ncbi:MAG TPA: hypothetical protein VFI24_08580 [Pyrinomonadaceae bacterium]|nr:hypothetical protein [Pyrinomonadaceae bacterium]
MKLASVILIILATVTTLAAQSSSCKVGVVAAPVGFWTWAPETKIKVYILGADFEPNEVEYLLAPLATWNTVSETTGSNVKFEYQGITNTPLYCENCLTIVRGHVFDKSKRHLTELRTYSAARNRIMTWATIVVDPLLKNPRSLTNALVHELGHSFGLLDCYSCQPNSTVMIQFKAVNVPNDMDRPSDCDVAQVKVAYQTLAAQLKRVTQLKSLPVDEGEEPVDDDTPIVVRKP